MLSINNCSPEATAQIETGVVDSVGTSEQRYNAKFPFQALNIGQCFILGIDFKMNSIRASVSRFNKEALKKFVIIRHKEYKCYEVARIG